MNPLLRPTRARVSLTQLEKNFHAIQQHVGRRVNILGVVKANAYGHGAVPVARLLRECDVRRFGVATVEEAIELRRAGVQESILLFGGFFPSQVEAIRQFHLTPAVFAQDQLRALERAFSSRHPAPIHLKFDTGMGRLGIPFQEVEKFLDVVKRLRHIRIEGIFSHLASADDLYSTQTDEQIACFQAILEMAREKKISVGLRHLANSAAVETRADAWFDIVRPGIVLYGYPPVGGRIPGVAPALSLDSKILFLKEVSRGTPLGYNATFVTRRRSRIATVPIGYADGLNRLLSFSDRHNKSRGVTFADADAVRPWSVIVRDRLAPIVGRISMDLTLVDVTEVPRVRVGDPVVFIGSSESHTITAADFASRLATIPYEILCAISARVLRVYD